MSFIFPGGLFWKRRKGNSVIWTHSSLDLPPIWTFFQPAWFSHRFFPSEFVNKINPRLYSCHIIPSFLETSGFRRLPSVRPPANAPTLYWRTPFIAICQICRQPLTGLTFQIYAFGPAGAYTAFHMFPFCTPALHYYTRGEVGVLFIMLVGAERFAILSNWMGKQIRRGGSKAV